MRENGPILPVYHTSSDDDSACGWYQWFAEWLIWVVSPLKSQLSVPVEFIVKLIHLIHSPDLIQYYGEIEKQSQFWESFRAVFPEDACGEVRRSASSDKLSSYLSGKEDDRACAVVPSVCQQVSPRDKSRMLDQAMRKLAKTPPLAKSSKKHKKNQLSCQHLFIPLAMLLEPFKTRVSEEEFSTALKLMLAHQQIHLRGVQSQKLGKTALEQTKLLLQALESSPLISEDIRRKRESHQWLMCIKADIRFKEGDFSEASYQILDAAIAFLFSLKNQLRGDHNEEGYGQPEALLCFNYFEKLLTPHVEAALRKAKKQQRTRSKSLTRLSQAHQRVKACSAEQPEATDLACADLDDLERELDYWTSQLDAATEMEEATRQVAMELQQARSAPERIGGFMEEWKGLSSSEQVNYSEKNRVRLYQDYLALVKGCQEKQFASNVQCSQ